jgi:hypothetical protein
MKKGYEERARDKHAEKMRQASEKAKAAKARKATEQNPKAGEKTEPSAP